MSYHPTELMKKLFPNAGVNFARRLRPEVLTPTTYGIRLLAGNGVTAQTHAELIKKITRINDRVDMQLAEYEGVSDGALYVSRSATGWQEHNELRPFKRSVRPIDDRELHALIDDTFGRYFRLHLSSTAFKPVDRRQHMQLDTLVPNA